MSLINAPAARVLKGWLKPETMPTSVKGTLRPAVPFESVHANFLRMAAPKAQNGTDYDIPNEPPCYDQGDLGSCVLNATCGAVDMLEAVNGNPPLMPARLFLYWLCRLAMGTLNQDSGTYTHLAVDRIGRVGVCPESMWTYSDAMFLDANGNAIQPTPECFPAASDNIVSSWFNIQDPTTPSAPSRLDQLEAAIRANTPVIFGTDCSQQIMDYQAGQVLSIPSGPIIGGHSMVFSGIRYINGQRCWRIRNSWGLTYGDAGHLLIDDKWASWASLNDLWVLTKVNPLLF